MKLVKNQIRVDLQTYDARIVLHYDTGERYNYSEVSFDQAITRYCRLAASPVGSVLCMHSILRKLTIDWTFLDIDIHYIIAG